MSGSLAFEVWKLQIPPLPKNSHLSASMIRWVLFALCDIADDDGTHCFPSVSYMAWKTDCSKPLLYRVIAFLQQQGVLVEVGSSGDLTAYDIHLEKLEYKPAFERPRKGRPRGLSTNSFPREKSFSQGEKFLPGRKVSPGEKSRLLGRKVVSQGEKFSPGDTAMLAADGSPAQDQSGAAASEPCAESALLTSLITLTYEPSGADAPEIPLKKKERREPEPDPLPFAQAGAWAQTKRGQAWMRKHGYSIARRSSSSELVAYRGFMQEQAQQREAARV